MLDRRTFIQASLVVAALPTMTLARTVITAEAGLYVVVDGVCGDARRFAAQCASAMPAASDALTVVAALARDDARRCFGLSRDSHYFVIEQMAADLGYRPGYHGVHDYRADGLRHQLTGARAIVNPLAEALARAGAAWTGALADALPSLTDDRGRDTRVDSRSDSARPADSGGYLVSWCLHRT